MIDIVLATFNGELFLKAQIHSIQNNSGYQKLISRFIIVDDGSTDNSLKIVRELAIQDDKIELVINDSEAHGPSQNFAFGLTKTSADYIMLSDQDDIWLPEKIALSLQKMQQLEASSEQEKALPLLVFSDKIIVDASLQVISGSYFELKNISKRWHHEFNRLCQQNVASGCTMLLNRALLNKAMPIPRGAYMHDWWLALVASRCGKLGLINQPLIQYRQHQQNSIGANKRSLWQLFSSFSLHLTKFEQSFLQTSLQAQAFCAFEKKYHLVESNTLKALANIHSYSLRQRMVFFLNKTIRRSHLLGNIALFIVLLKMKSIK